MWAAVVHYASTSAPKGLEATTQALFSGVFGGLGGGTGCIAGGKNQ
jgi:hypothetical protein